MTSANELPRSLTRTWFLAAGETDAAGLMPVTLMAARAIEVATLHANALGIGYARLVKHHMGWVLARLTIEVDHYPGINSTYSMTTWIDSINRRFSDRCFEMTDADGRVCARIRSVWVAIDTETRTMADLAAIDPESLPLGGRSCPVDRCRQPSIAPGAECQQQTRTWAYSDLDFNRHVNTLRYLAAAIDCHSLEFHDANSICRLEASFDHECHYGDTMTLLTGPSRRDSAGLTTEIIAADGTRAVAVELVFTPRL